jgi:futalosine hydrolase
VVSEEFADLGIEDNSEFFTLFESGFLKENDFPFEKGQLKATDSNGLLKMKKVHGITSNKSHGNINTINALTQKFSAHIESMEGAAVIYVCNQFNIPCYQVRAISNYVEPRDPVKWNIPLALINLKVSLLQTLRELSVPVN